MITQARKQHRNNSERRTDDRRQADFVFNSLKWIEQMQMNYIAWPKIDRRKTFRRDGERRFSVREEHHATGFKHDYTSDVLSREEKLYFDQIFMSHSD